MNHWTRSFLSLSAVATLSLQCGMLASAQLTESPNAPAVTHLRISAPARQQVIPETLFGSFLEPIGHSTYGGLWADIVENPSMEEGLWSAGNVVQMLQDRPELQRASSLGLPLPWEPLDAHQGNRYLSIRGNAANSNQSLLIMSLPGKETGILQRVYPSAARQLTYNGSLMVRHVRGNDVVNVSLRKHHRPTEILASAVLHSAPASWTKLSFQLALKPDTVAPLEPVDLVISVSDDARVQVDSISLFPSDAVDGMDPEVVAMAKDLRSPVVRFGGNFTSAYRWQDGVGPRDKRVSVINPSWGIPEYNTFGTDEFLRFCELIQARPQVALNLGTGTPEEAGEWVRYVNAHFGDHHGGLLWELGNELWGDFQIGYPSLSRVADITRKTSEAVRAVDPHAQLIATGGDEDFFHEWNAQQLSTPPSTFDYLSTHFVVQDNTRLQDSTAEFRTAAALALPTGLAGKLRDMHQQAVDAGRGKVQIAFTEWLMVSDSHTGPNFRNLGGAMFAGSFLNMLMRNADIVGISDMTGIVEFGGIWKKSGRVYGAPAYWVLREYSQARPHWLLDVQSDGGTYSVKQGVTRLPEIANVPYLDCSAALTEDKRTAVLTCVNNHLDRDIPANLDVQSGGALNTRVAISTISGDSILSENDEHRPSRVVPSRETAILQGSVLAHVFPAHSITVLQVPVEPPTH